MHSFSDSVSNLLARNAAARGVLKLRKHNPIRQEMSNLHWLRITERILFKVMVMTFK